MVGSAARNLFVDIDIDPSSCQSDSMDLFWHGRLGQSYHLNRRWAAGKLESSMLSRCLGLALILSISLTVIRTWLMFSGAWKCCIDVEDCIIRFLIWCTSQNGVGHWLSLPMPSNTRLECIILQLSSRWRVQTFGGGVPSSTIWSQQTYLEGYCMSWLWQLFLSTDEKSYFHPLLLSEYSAWLVFQAKEMRKSNAQFTMSVTVGWRWLPWCWLNGPNKHSETKYWWAGKLYLEVVRGRAIRALEEHCGEIWNLKMTTFLALNLEKVSSFSDIKI